MESFTPPDRESPPKHFMELCRWSILVGVCTLWVLYTRCYSPTVVTHNLHA